MSFPQPSSKSYSNDHFPFLRGFFRPVWRRGKWWGGPNLSDKGGELLELNIYWHICAQLEDSRVPNSCDYFLCHPLEQSSGLEGAENDSYKL